MPRLPRDVPYLLDPPPVSVPQQRRRLAAGWIALALLVVGAAACGSWVMRWAPARRDAEESRRREFSRALYTADIDTVRDMLAAGLDVRSSATLLGARDDRRPLAIAAEVGNAEIVDLLLDAGAPVDLPEPRYGRTPLFAAVSNPMGTDPDRVSRLVAAGADPMRRDPRGATILHALLVAAEPARPEFYEVDLGRRSALPGQVRILDGRVDPDLTEIVRRLLDSTPIPVDAADDFGRTPLMLAMRLDDPDLVADLLVRGADPTRRDAAGRDALDHLLRHVAHGFPSRTDALVTMLFEAGLDVNRRGEGGRTPLLSAVRAGASSRVVRDMITRGARLDAADGDGWTALHHAVARAILLPGDADSRDQVELLLGLGADPARADATGRSPRDYTRDAGFEDLLDGIGSAGD